MPKIPYGPPIKFSAEAIDVIARANRVFAAHAKGGFSTTLRQLYYEFVGRKWFPPDRKYSPIPGTNRWELDLVNGTHNATPNYKWLGDIIGKGRMAGLVDWNAIEDRTRSSKANQHWTRPSEILEGALNTYETDKWETQEHYLECWVEKESLEQVLSVACKPLDVRFFACRGYTSDPAMWEASQRLMDQMTKGKEVHIIHLGDHDPSGIDMSRDIEEKLVLFTGGRIHLDRIALNMDQVRKYNLLPDPAKATDSRFRKYQELFGDESWELDALGPQKLVELVQASIIQYRDEDKWAEAVKREELGKGTLRYILQYFPDVVEFLKVRRKRDDSRIVCMGCMATEANPVCLCDGEKRGLLLT